MTDVRLWDRVDEPVLRWVATLPPTFGSTPHGFAVRDPEPFDPIPGLSSLEVHESVARLASHRLVDGHEQSMNRVTYWSRLRVTSRGWIVLGEWPDLDRVASAASLHRLLRALAEDAPDEDRDPLVRAAGVLSRTADEILRGTVAEVAGTLGQEVVDE